MNNNRDLEIHLIPLEHISVLNPRERGKRKFAQIINNIEKLGLKKPITVTRKEHTRGNQEYYLVCGQGRYEAYKILGEPEIPALIVNVTKEELLLMSLVENLARRQHSTLELVRDISDMRDRNYTFAQIAEKTALEVSYVRGIVKLLKKGEERLLQAVEKGQIPISIAVIIASSNDHQIQKALTEAYEKNTLRGNKLLTARKLVEKRRMNGKGLKPTPRKKKEDEVSSQKLLRVYEEETAKQKLLIHKSRLCETQLLFVVSALRQLFQDEQMTTILQAEDLDTLPAYLISQIYGEAT
jgi:ParB family chromosome partitioning protein